jgi:hypothetical protein
MSTSFTFNVQTSSNAFSSKPVASWTQQNHSDVMHIHVPVFPSEEMDEIEMTVPCLIKATPFVQVVDNDYDTAD